MSDGELLRIAAIERDVKWIRERLEKGDEFMRDVAAILQGNPKLGIRGMIAKVDILWNSHVAIVGLAGTAIGSIVTAVILKVMG